MAGTGSEWVAESVLNLGQCECWVSGLSVFFFIAYYFYALKQIVFM